MKVSVLRYRCILPSCACFVAPFEVDPSLPLPPWEPQLPVAQRTAEASVTPYKRNKISQAMTEKVVDVEPC